MSEAETIAVPATQAQEESMGYTPIERELPKKDEFGATGGDRVYNDPDIQKNLEG